MAGTRRYRRHDGDGSDGVGRYDGVEGAATFSLQRRYARACRMSDEMLCLLKPGFPDARFARQRTLYGIAVISTWRGGYI